LLISIRKRILGLGKKVRWYWQYKFQKLVNRVLDIQRIDTNKLQNVLIIAPHADDEIVGCYKLLSSPNKVLIFCLSLTGSNINKENKQIRRIEFLELSKNFGVDVKISNGQYSEELEKIIYRFKPENIFLPHYIDWHQEHIFASILLKEVINNINYECSVYSYQISVPISSYIITHYIPMNFFEQRTKWNIFNTIYKSQRHLPVFRFKLQEKISGKLVESYAAEVFVKLDLNKWKLIIDKIALGSISYELGLLKGFINNINNIRNKSDCIQRKFGAIK